MRTRTDSLHGLTTLNDNELAMLQGDHVQGSITQQHPTSNVLLVDKPNSLDSSGSPEPVTEQVKPLKKPGTRLVKIVHLH